MAIVAGVDFGTLRVGVSIGGAHSLIPCTANAKTRIMPGSRTMNQMRASASWPFGGGRHFQRHSDSRSNRCREAKPGARELSAGADRSSAHDPGQRRPDCSGEPASAWDCARAGTYRAPRSVSPTVIPVLRRSASDHCSGCGLLSTDRKGGRRCLEAIAIYI
jgi:hypothetical protein